MYLNLKTILKLPVYTESGTHLGRVRDVELDVEAHHVRHYLVAAGLLSKDDYIITPAQVKAITTQKMIVEDSVGKIVASTKLKNTSPTPALSGVSARIQE